MFYTLVNKIVKGAQVTLLAAVATAGLCLTAPSVLADSNDIQANDTFDAIIDRTTETLGGDISAPGQFPYMAAMVHNDSRPLRNRLFCGASFINEKWLVTAAHCMYDLFDNRRRASSFRVVTNFVNLRTESPQEYVVANYFIHPDFIPDRFGLYDDIALVELANAAPVTTVPLYNDDASELAGYNSVIVGWGSIEYKSRNDVTYPDELRHAQLPVHSRAVCNSPAIHRNTLRESQICAGLPQGGVDTCTGDSGGPILADIEGVVTQIGITSFGYGCALPYQYGIYTNISHYMDWIKQYTTVETVDRPEVLAPTVNVGAAAGAPSTGGGGAAWYLLGLMAGIALRRRT